jgi:hypothetical protein
MNAWFARPSISLIYSKTRWIQYVFLPQTGKDRFPWQSSPIKTSAEKSDVTKLNFRSHDSQLSISIQKQIWDVGQFVTNRCDQMEWGTKKTKMGHFSFLNPE